MPRTTKLTAVLPPDLDVRSHTLLASLWSNYGHIYRLTLDTPAPHTLILKLIQPPLMTASSSESHRRKLISYNVERFFYAHLSTQLPALAPVARSYPVAAHSRHEALLLEDLAPAYPTSRGPPHAVLTWLANFHATFWATDTPVVTTAAAPPEGAGVWADGGYWYLATRRAEYAEMACDPRYAYLAPFVEYAARQLQRCDAPGRTLLHGDCKSANVVFARGGGGRCALYDFQYVGRGFGVQDVAYFIATSVDRVEAEEEALLRVYYVEVLAALERRGVQAGGYTWEVLVEQWEWALVDWMRFMAGWGCWGNAVWVEGRVKAICRRWKEEGRGAV